MGANIERGGEMKVKVKISDFNDACIKDVIYNGYIEVEAEPVEEETPEWEKKFDKEICKEHDIKIGGGVFSSPITIDTYKELSDNKAVEIKSFIRNLLKEFGENFKATVFLGETSIKAIKNIYEEYGIED